MLRATVVRPLSAGVMRHWMRRGIHSARPISVTAVRECHHNYLEADGFAIPRMSVRLRRVVQIGVRIRCRNGDHLCNCKQS